MDTNIYIVVFFPKLRFMIPTLGMSFVPPDVQAFFRSVTTKILNERVAGQKVGNRKTAEHKYHNFSRMRFLSHDLMRDRNCPSPNNGLEFAHETRPMQGWGTVSFLLCAVSIIHGLSIMGYPSPPRARNNIKRYLLMTSATATQCQQILNVNKY